MSELPDSALIYILKGLMVPYSDANMKLAFKPAWFFSDLEKISNKKRQTLRNSYYKAVKQGFIELGDDDRPRLTDKGRQKLKTFRPEKLKGDARLMVIFDIPEDERYKRRYLRMLLRELRFSRVQQSVWLSEFDSRDYLVSEIKQHGLQNYVVVFEAAKLI